MKKLVRDNIPDIIEQGGGKPVVATLGDGAFMDALKQKIVEEAQEVAAQHEVEDVLAELADVQEVVNAIREHVGATEEELENIRAHKAVANGAYKKRLFIESVDQPEE